MKKEIVKYLVKVIVLTIIVTLMSKFIPFRGNRPLTTWGELLCDLPLIIIISFIAIFVGELRKKSNRS